MSNLNDSALAATGRTLLVTNDFPPQVGGIQQYVRQIALRLPGAAVFAADHPNAVEHDAVMEFPVYRGPTEYMFPTARVERSLRSAILRHRADLLLFMAPFPLAPLGSRMGLPFGVCTHGAELVVPSRVPGLNTAYRRWLHKADCLFSVSAHTGAHLRDLVGVQGPPIRILHNGAPPTADGEVDPEGVRRKHGLGDDPVITCVGRLVPRKGQDKLVAALEQIRESVPGTRLLLVGEGRLEGKLERASRQLPPGSVILAGRVPGREVMSYIAAGDVFAHPNRTRWMGLEHEGFGIIFLEAQACGRPVVAGRSGGSPEALVEGETGLLVDGTSTEDIAEAIIALLADRDRATRMGEAGKEFVKRHFSWDDIVGRLEDDLTAVRRGDRPARDL